MTDNVNHPAHYTEGGIETIDYIEAKEFLGYHILSAIKYLSRFGLKDPATRIEDLEKAVWFIQRKIAILRAGA